MNPATGDKNSERRRLPADRWRALILDAAVRVIARDGVERFSLEEVAREAGVAATLPRHYFKSRDGLLAATVSQLSQGVLEPLLRRDASLRLEDRYRLYLQQIDEVHWAHGLWEQAEAVHPELGAEVVELRRLLVALSFGRPWDELSPAERLRGAGWIGFFSAAVTEWIRQGRRDVDVIVRVLLDGARRFELPGA